MTQVTRGYGHNLVITRGYGFPYSAFVPLTFVADGRPRQLRARGAAGKKQEIKYDVDRRLPHEEYRIKAQLTEVNGEMITRAIMGDTGKLYFDPKGYASVIVTSVSASKTDSTEDEIVIRVRLLR